ncbi:amino acid adenylation domain-containing protein [Kitasatospora acidiphila]|uniref:Amino acid adenylation domain-containing protein n=1 Tax=Kitasatospora acidiphila TaxID=2567942 RepID=A0A540VXR5_9ACTN|nr:non-ribosomal peptide synthetase [Kitasatospora acidiphila]TQF01517.1 amino acid adenylation domain-containing protein [Kitasatospora acidiphila]
MIYTSGSTGRPKGVAVTHTGVASLAAAQAERFAVDGGSRLLQFASVSFDAAVSDLLVALSSGAALVLADAAELVPGAGLVELVARHGVTHLTLPPAVLAVLDPASLPSVRTLVSAGEALGADLVDRWAAGRRFVNAYGPTETTVCATMSAPLAPGDLPTIGGPIANARVYVLDEQLGVLPPGVAGDLYVAGPGLARGYLGRPDSTAERFVACPFGPEGHGPLAPSLTAGRYPQPGGGQGGRMYRTGDRVKWTADGRLVFTGRADEQLKIRGFRVEPGEVQAVLAGHPGVARTAVVAREGALVAYLVPTTPGSVPEDLREFTARRLPEYLVPAAFVALDTLPLTPNGKLDRAALPAPDQAGAAAGRGPETVREEILCAAFAEVLGLERVGVDDDFFELGGHSLLVVSLVEALRVRGVSVSVGALFQTPTPAGLACSAAAEQVVVEPNLIPADATELTPAMLPLIELDESELAALVAQVDGGAANIADVYPLAPLQEGFFFHHLMARQDGADSDVYVAPTVLAFDTRKRLDGFLAALQQVVDRHDIYRTAIVWEGLREPAQVVLRHARLPIVPVVLAPEGPDPVDQLLAVTPSWLDLRRAPLMDLHIAAEPGSDRWLAMLRFHHLIQDHTSMEVMITEVAALMAGRGDRLPRPLPFRTFVAQARGGVPQAEHARYFRELLGDLTQTTAPFGAVDVPGGDAGERARLTLDSALAARTRELARRLGVSAATVFHLAWIRVLAAVSGQDDVVFGTVLFGRMNAGAGSDRVPGLFLNTLPMRMRIGALTVTEALAATRDRLAELLVHEHAPLALARQASALPAGSPLFAAIFNYRHQQAATRAAGGLEGIEVRYSRERSDYPLNVTVDDDGAEFRLTIEATAAAEPVRVGALLQTALGHLVTALESAPQTRLAAVPTLDREQRDQVLARWNDTAAELPAGLVPEVFAAQAARTPDAVAVRSGERTATFGELAARANQLAHYLRAQGVGPESVVGLCLPAGVELLTVILGVWQAGAAYLPLDPQYPADRLAFMLRDSRAGALIGTLDSLDELPAGLLRTIALDEPLVAAQLANRSAEAPEGGLTAERLAYVMYTSGSTGRPKGVAVTHGGLANYVLWAADAYGMAAGGGAPLHSSPAFDLTVTSLLVPLVTGSTVVVSEAGGAEGLADLMAGEPEFGLVKVVPGHLPLLAELLPDEAAARSTRRLIVGGEALHGADVRAWLERAPGSVLVNEYGPTETVVGCCVHELTAGQAIGDVVPIGRPIANTRLFVLDEHLQPAPIGVPGEVYIAGAQLARGYLGRPDLTAERFVANPFGAGDGLLPGGARAGRMYRSGDLARWTADGLLEYLGRVDEQVKVGGYRIEPGEVQAVIAGHRSVAQAAVIAREDVPGDRRLVAYVVPSGGAGEGLADAVRDHAAARLPEHMRPSTVVVLDTLPVTRNGKLDRAALPAPVPAAPAGGRAPLTTQEELLCQAFAQVLGLAAVGADDDFFALGGQSLLATRLVSRVRAVLGVELPIRVLFERPTPAAIAAHLTGAARGRTALTPVARPERPPLSFAQRRLWFIGRLEGPSATYNVPMAVRLTGTLDRAALAAALRDVIGRHEVLRTVLRLSGGEPYQWVLPLDETGFELPVVELSAEELPAALTLEAGRGFDLAAEIPLRACLFGLGPADHVLLLVVHHIATDGWSTAPLTRDVSRAYAARTAGRAPGWEPLPVQYADYALWQRELLGNDGEPSDLLADQLAYWRAALAGVPQELALPADHVRPALAGHRGHTAPVAVPADVHARLVELTRSEGVTTFMVLQGALAVLLSRWGAGSDIPIGSPSAGRTDEALDELVGCFVNTLVLRTDLTGDPTFREVLRRVRESSLSAFAHQDVPFERLVEELAPDRSMARHPLFQVMLTLHDNAGAVLRLAGLDAQAVPVSRSTARFDLDLNLGEQFDADGAPAGLRGALVASADLFEPETAERLATGLARVLEQLLAAPQERLSTVRVLDGSERQQILTAWNDTAAVVPDTTLAESFAAQAARTPDAVAVVFDGVRVSYAELDARANRLARHLIACGVGAESVVGVCLERSVELVVALLAVVKAGGAYLPVDPEHPAERIALTLADAGAVCVLTTDACGGALPTGAARVAVDDPLIAEQSSEAPEVRVLPAHPAYVIFTSGSTGRPKGVVVPHEGIVNRLAWMQELSGIGAGDRVLQKTPFGFDVSVWEFFWPLVQGAAVVLARPGGHRDPAYLAALVREQGVTVAHFVPSVLELFVREPAAAGCTGLRAVFCSGEALAAPLRDRFLELLDGVPLFNLYGPTEASVDVTAARCRADDGAVVPIGGPVANTRVYVLDGSLSPVPVGVAGELYLAGVQLARGYADRAALTAERFVACPFEAGARLYRTGDRVKWTADGRLVYLGRTDDQVKIRGVRIEPGEVQAVLAAHPAVDRIAVVARDGLLVAYLVPAHPGITAEGLREFAALSLPEHLVPSAVVVLDALPVTANGKLDRDALPAPEYTAARGRGPATLREEIMCRAFAEVLGLPIVGAEDDFFALGGHSLLAVALAEHLRAQGVPVSVRALFRTPTPAGLAAAAASEVEAPPNLVPDGAEELTPEMLPLAGLTAAELDRVVAQVPGGAANVADVYPLAPLQEGFFYHYLAADPHGGGADVYAVPFVLGFDARERLDAFLAALQQVVDRHDVYRTAIVWEGLREPVQVVLRRAELPVREVVLDTGSADPVEQLPAIGGTRMDLRRAP